ncbi:MAG: heterodisulfide reductase subunit F [Deltaproteobacteria bacterium]|nr:heterodisulfide reductase subunit F [Deltaproteobacteria bacterium]MBM4324816.1 heterodisulfide reductase subunit F [Deltaproteobacteria bacterium]
MKNPYLPIPMILKKAQIETSDRMLRTLELTFRHPEDEEKFRYVPGQFCELSALGKGEAPFGIASSPTEKGSLKFTINKAGLVTTELHHVEEGSEIGIRGPLGNGYPIDLFQGKNLVIIGGGFAFTTLRSLIAYFLHPENRPRIKGITVIYGARMPGLLLYKEELLEWEKRDDLRLVTTVDWGDKDWKGKVGLVPNVLEEVAPSAEETYAVICGPPVMIKFTFPKLMTLRFPNERIFTSLEKRMKCGIGKCGRCNIGHLYVCKDGPVFSYAQLEKLPKDY